MRSMPALILMATLLLLGCKSGPANSEAKPGHHTARLVRPLDRPYPAPEITGINAWINSNPLTLETLRGRVVLIDFWTYSCINCLRTLPYITRWDKKYRDQGLVIIGIHAPEFEFEKNLPNVKNAVIQNGIHYPVALDSDYGTWVAYHNNAWPAHYLIDKNGTVVYTHVGEGGYEDMEQNIRVLLDTEGPATETGEAKVSETGNYGTAGIWQTPETYLGYARARTFKSPEGLNPDVTQTYTFPESLPLHNWALRGPWRAEAEKTVSKAPGAALRLNFSAKKVFLVLGSETGNPVTVKLTLNGKPLKPVTVKAHTLYPLLSQDGPGNGELDILPQSAGLEVYAFTFGS